MTSLLGTHIENTLDRYFATDEFKGTLRRHVKWAVQGFAPGFTAKDREAFTETVARRIRKMSRVPVYLFGVRVWRRPTDWKLCREDAERIVTDFLSDEQIEFGDPAYYWGDGVDLADEDMSYWDTCP